MKIPANRLAEFLRRPPPEMRGALLYGPDAGLVRERADLLTAAICGNLKDPFRISELSASILAADTARLADEVAAMSLVGGRRVVRIRDAGEAVTALLAETASSSSTPATCRRVRACANYARRPPTPARSPATPIRRAISATSFAKPSPRIASR
jgi:DNA polymerase-3 subunit delta